MKSQKYMRIICWSVIIVLAGCQSRNGGKELSGEVYETLCTDEVLVSDRMTAGEEKLYGEEWGETEKQESTEVTVSVRESKTYERPEEQDREALESAEQEKNGSEEKGASGELMPDTSTDNQTKLPGPKNEAVRNDSSSAVENISPESSGPVAPEGSQNGPVNQPSEDSGSGEKSADTEEVKESEKIKESDESKNPCASGHTGGIIQYFPCEPFCTAGSVGWYVCEVCGADYGHRDFPALGHEAVKENYRSGNCMEPELWDVVCSRCNELLEWDVQGVKDPGKHDYIMITLKKWDESMGDMVEYQEESCALCGAVK